MVLPSVYFILLVYPLTVSCLPPSVCFIIMILLFGCSIFMVSPSYCSFFAYLTSECFLIMVLPSFNICFKKKKHMFSKRKNICFQKEKTYVFIAPRSIDTCMKITFANYKVFLFLFLVYPLYILNQKSIYV